jgi:hypothetical protein
MPDDAPRIGNAAGPAGLTASEQARETAAALAGSRVRRRSKRGGLHPRFSVPRLRKRSKPGAVAGIESSDLAGMPSAPERVSMTCIDYGPGRAQVQEVQDVAAFLAAHRPEWATVRWINSDGSGATRSSGPSASSRP